MNDICSIKALNYAWKKFARGKSARVDVAQFKKDLQPNIKSLHGLLVSGEYRHQSYERFLIHDPKQRQIHKASVRDRVVHQAIVTALEPLFEPRFIYDSYSCRLGKGTHAGVQRLETFLRQESRNNTQKVYVLKCDIRKYFASVDHVILLQLIARRVTDDAILELVREILLSHEAETGKGIPLGNVTSQLFANIYLHELDWFMKQTLGVRYYARYCDDFVIVSHHKAYLEGLIEPIRHFLRDRLQLELHPQKVMIRSWDQGIDFLGCVLRPHAKTIRTKTRRRMLRRVTEQNLSSYLGMCGHVDEYETARLLQTVAWRR